MPQRKNNLNFPKLNILFLSSWYPSDTHRTLGNFVQRHAESIALLHRVHVLYITAEIDQGQELRIAETHSGNLTTTIVYYPKKGLSLLSRWNAFRYGLNHISKSKKLEGFDLCHMNVIWNGGWQARYIHRKLRLPYIITEHWTGYDLQRKKERPLLLRSFSGWVVKKAHALCPVSADLEEKMNHFGLTGNYVVVPNVVDTELFQKGEKSDSRIEFLHVSHLGDDHKNISGILKVWKKISDENEKVFLRLGGDGNYEEWRKYASDLGIRPSAIDFFGEQSPAGIASMMSTSHCLLLFSRYENLPVVIIEALSCGMAVISSDVGGIHEHINQERGMLVESEDETGLKNAVQQYIHSYKSYSPEKMRYYAVAHFSEEAVAKAYDVVYRSAVSKG